MALPRRNAVATPAPTAVAQPAVGGFNFGDLNNYSGGGGIPPGAYALEFNVQLFQPQNQQGVTKGPIRLGVMVTAHSLSDPAHRGDNAYTQFYSMGSAADKSFAPRPDGKGVLPIPGGPATTMNNQTNWFIFIKSLYDCGLPQGILSNDFTVIDGIHVEVTQVPEPSERATFIKQQNALNEAAPTEDRRPQNISIVSEIKDNGKPWEGSGGIPAAGAPAVAPAPVSKPNGLARPAAAPAQTPAPTTAQAQTSQYTDEDIAIAAQSAVTEVLTKNLKGLPRLKLRTDSFNELVRQFGDDVAQAVTNVYFATGMDDNLSTLLGELGYKLEGPQVKPA